MISGILLAKVRIFEPPGINRKGWQDLNVQVRF